MVRFKSQHQTFYRDFLTNDMLFLHTLFSIVIRQIFRALLVLFHSVTLFMANATSNLRTILVKVNITINIITVTTNLIHLITEPFFLPPSNLIFQLATIWNILRAIVLGPM